MRSAVACVLGSVAAQPVANPSYFQNRGKRPENGPSGRTCRLYFVLEIVRQTRPNQLSSKILPLF